VSYEYFLSEQVGLGVGAALLIWFDWNEALFPVYLSYLPITGSHSPYLSGGYTFRMSMDKGTDFVPGNLSFALGYQYRHRGGFFLRPSVGTSYDFEDEKWVAWPGLALGWTF
jgi:hypothetical protein